MRDHDLRQRAVGEMHLRRWPLLPVPCHVIQWVLAIDAHERDAELAMIDSVADAQSEAANPLHREGRLDDRVRFTWERQSEGTSLTLFVERCDQAMFLDTTRDPQVSRAIAWARTLPGQIIRTTRLWIDVSDDAIAPLIGQLALNRDELVSVRLGDKLRMWSDFRIMPDGFGCMLVAANGTDPRDLTRQMQRLQELGNYRNKALLGLPVARDSWPRLDHAESRLRDLTDRIGDDSARDDSLLDELSALALELAAISAGTSFRLDATRAYGQIVEERLEQLDSREIEGFGSLTDFTQRRFRPAMNTCLATAERIGRLAVRTEQLTSLLRARIDTRIENQNARLLASMDRSISVQTQLQQLVEGLSAVALTYYLLSLVKLALYAVPDPGHGVSDEKIIGILVLPVLLGIWFGMRLLKKQLLGKDAH